MDSAGKYLMDKRTEQLAKREADRLAKKHNISDVKLIVAIIKKIVSDRNSMNFPHMAMDYDFLHGGLVFTSLLDQALAALPLGEVQKVFGSNHTYVLAVRSSILTDWLEGGSPFYTREELQDGLAGLVDYLEHNRTSLVSTGYPQTALKESPWLYYKLGRLYPVRIPGAVDDRLIFGLGAGAIPLPSLWPDQRSNPEAVVLRDWAVTLDRGITSFPSREKNCSYEEFIVFSRLTKEEAKRIEEARARLFNLRIRVLQIAQRCLASAIKSENSDRSLWEECLDAMSETLSRQELEFFSRVDWKYSELNSLYQLSSSTRTITAEPIADCSRHMESGTISNLVGFVLFVQEELLFGSTHLAKMRFNELIGHQSPASYFQFTFSVKTRDIDQVILDALKLARKGNELHGSILERMKRGFEQKSKNPLFVLPKYYDVVGAYADFLEKHENIGIDVTARLAATLPHTKEICPIKLPPETIWEDITIKFLDGHTVNIRAKELNVDANYKEMGFDDSRRRLPNKQWKFLQLLADQKGELSWDKPGANRYVKKKKQRLADTLRLYFQIEEDPFLPYKQQKAYKIRINLIP